MMKFSKLRIGLSLAALGLLFWTACNLAPAPTLLDPAAPGKNLNNVKLGAQDFKLMDDKPAKLSDYQGKAVVLDFWATYCGPCVAAMPDPLSVPNARGRPAANRINRPGLAAIS